jgi:glycerol-3-phosphate dehydrogenase (NAD(P)+)
VQRFAVLGAGAWGTACALLLAQNPAHRVTLWSARAESGRQLAELRENRRLLPGVRIPECISLTTDIVTATADANLWVLGIPTVYLRTTLQRLTDTYATRPVPVLSLTKGLELTTLRRPSEIIAEVLGTWNVAVMSGPSHAEEVGRGLPGSVTVASRAFNLAHQVQQVFGTERFRVYTNQDIVGVELGGALKNVLGIAAGICDGLGYGDNAKAALLTRGLAEMARFGVALGAEIATFYGLAGLGDLVATCVSPHGRNRRVGERLGKGERLSTILAGMEMVAEGVTTSRSVYDRARQMGLDMPILTGVYRVLYEDYPPQAAVQDLMLRRPTSEW